MRSRHPSLPSLPGRLPLSRGLNRFFAVFVMILCLVPAFSSARARGHCCGQTSADKQQREPKNSLAVVACLGRQGIPGLSGLSGFRRIIGIGRSGCRNLNRFLLISADLAFLMLQTLFRLGCLFVNNPLELMCSFILLLITIGASVPVTVLIRFKSVIVHIVCVLQSRHNDISAVGTSDRIALGCFRTIRVMTGKVKSFVAAFGSARMPVTVGVARPVGSLIMLRHGTERLTAHIAGCFVPAGSHMIPCRAV